MGVSASLQSLMFFISDSDSRAKCCFQDLEKERAELVQLAASLQAVISEDLALTEAPRGMSRVTTDSELAKRGPPMCPSKPK